MKAYVDERNAGKSPDEAWAMVAATIALPRAASGVGPAAMIAVAATPVIITGIYYGPKVAELMAASERARALPVPMPMSESKPTDITDKPTIPDISIPTDEDLPKGPLVPTTSTGQPTTTTAPTITSQPSGPMPPTGGSEKEPPKILPPIIGLATGTTIGVGSKVLADKISPDEPTPPTRVAQAGGRPDLYWSYKTEADVPAHYRNDQRFISLASDPDHAGKINSKSRVEAMAGLEAESQGLVKMPIQRGPKGIEFYDIYGIPYDVKAPLSPKPGDKWSFNPKEVGSSIQKELRDNGVPPGTFPNSNTGDPEPRRVILDSTYMIETDHKALWEWLNKNLTEDELNRIAEITIRP